MTAPGLSATDWYAPSTAMTAARDRARSSAADRRDALIARDRFTIDPQDDGHDDRRDAPVRRTDRSGAGTVEAAKPSRTRDADAAAAKVGGGAPTTGPDPDAAPARTATPRDAAAGPRLDRAAAWARGSDAGSARAPSVQTGGDADADTTGAAATDATGAGSAAETTSSDPGPQVADRGEAATAVPVVPVAPSPAPTPIVPAPTPQAATADGEGSARAPSAQTAAGAAAGTTGSAATEAQGGDAAAPSPSDAPPTIADPRDAATAVPVVPVGPSAVPTPVVPVAAPQTANGGGTSLETQVAAARAAGPPAGTVGSGDARASEPGRIDGDATPDVPETGTAEGAGFEGVLAQAAGDTTSGAVAPPDPTAAPAKVEASAAPRTIAPPAAPPPATPPLPLGAVPMTIGLRALKGSSQFEIRLDPVDLGRIDVTLDIDRDTGGASARLVVDRPETLALLQRDADSLQQALVQAGLDPGAAGISLSLRGEGSDGGGRETGAQDRDGGRPSRGAAGDADPAAPVAGAVRALRRLGGLDIRI